MFRTSCSMSATQGKWSQRTSHLIQRSIPAVLPRLRLLRRASTTRLCYATAGLTSRAAFINESTTRQTYGQCVDLDGPDDRYSFADRSRDDSNGDFEVPECSANRDLAGSSACRRVWHRCRDR